MSTKSVTPSPTETAFDCPHCGAYTTQTWCNLFARARPSDKRLPLFIAPDAVDRIRAKDPDVPSEVLKRFEREVAGLVIVSDSPDSEYSVSLVSNLHLSWCYNCQEVAVWVHGRLLFPESRGGPPPNPDMPDQVREVYDEASKILNLSPRGAAGLLRLAIQKLCVELKEPGKDLNQDIARLVKKGLSPLVQKALDSVRVIGNEAVHPGTLDLKDDIDTAGKLFRLLNIIVEQMISNPKHVEELFNKIPEEKKKGIEQRDKK